MAMIKNGVIKVDGIQFHWSVLRQPSWTRARTHDTPTLLGLAILIELPDASHRELVLEFDAHESRHRNMKHHQRFHLPDSRLMLAIEKAIEAGWDPHSRGKRFVFQAGTLQPR